MILTTAPPVYFNLPVNEAFRVNINARTRALAQANGSGAYLLDLDAILGTGANPNAYVPAYDQGDHVHINNAGANAAAIPLAAILRRIASMAY